MKKITVKTCSDCPFWKRVSMDPCECGHSDAPKKAYANIVGPRAIPPSWCPIRQKGGQVRKIIRDDNDKVIDYTLIKLQLTH